MENGNEVLSQITEYQYFFLNFVLIRNQFVFVYTCDFGQYINRKELQGF